MEVFLQHFLELVSGGEKSRQLIYIVILGFVAAFTLICVAGIIWCAIINLLKRLCRTANATPNLIEAPELNSNEVPVQPSQSEITGEQKRPPRLSLSAQSEEPVQTHLPSQSDSSEARVQPPRSPRADSPSQIYQNVEPRRPPKPFQIDQSGAAVRPSQLQDEQESQNIQLAVDTTVNLINELRERTKLEVVDEVQPVQHRTSQSARSADHPSFFVSPQREISLPSKAMKHHILNPGNLTPDSIAENALRLSEKRSKHIYENTVFCAPQKWMAWSTKRGPRIVSSERVTTIQCERKGRRGKFLVAWVDMKFAIFTKGGHLRCNESLQS